MIGTTIKDSQSEKSIIVDSFKEAFRINGFIVSDEMVKEERGKLKSDAIRNILNRSNFSQAKNDSIYRDFIELLGTRISNFIEMPGASDTFDMVKRKGIKVGIGSGLPKSFMLALIQHLNWSEDWFDYMKSSEQLGKGRPDPVMLLDSMDQLGVGDRGRILKIGDTLVDILEGQNARVLTAGVLTGGVKREEFQELSPNFIFNDINDLLDVI